MFKPSDPDSFNNANDWYDDTSDGPVTATVSIDGEPIPVEAAWVVVAPPNYAPDIVSWRTMYDLAERRLRRVRLDRDAAKALLHEGHPSDPAPPVEPAMGQQGFAAMFGKGCPMDFENDDFIAKLATKPRPGTTIDPYAELRQVIFNNFRPPQPTVSEPVVWPHVWPWIYGDAFGSFPANGPGNMLTMTGPSGERAGALGRRRFRSTDWPPAAPPPNSLDKVPLAERPRCSTRARCTSALRTPFIPAAR